MLHIRIAAIAVVLTILCALFAPTFAGDKSDTIILGGDHGCGPKLLLKTSKKKGDILVMQDCKKKHKETHYIPYPVYHTYEHYGHEGYGHQDYGHGGYGHGYY